jgi:hypothetical protein
MTKPAPCQWTARVDAHFAGKNSVTEEHELRQHLLAGCPTCHRRYTRQAMLAKLQPDAPSAKERLGVALGLRRRTRSRLLTGLCTMVAACGTLAFFVVGRTDPGFQARGLPAAAGDARAELLVFRVRPGAPNLRAADRFSAKDELAFAYRNGAGKRHLFIFGVDEHRHVYWFAPAWKEARELPAAPMATADGALHELEDAVGHVYDGARLDVHALFTDRAWRLEELEAVVGGAAPGAPLSFAGDVYLVRSFEVDR